MNGSRLQRIWPLALIVALGVVCYANSFRNGFVWDDKSNIVANPLLRSWEQVPVFFTRDLPHVHADLPYYRPLWMLSLLADFQLWGLNPFGFHLTNLALHIAVALLLYALLAALRVRRAWSLLAAAIFVCHPALTESVTFMANRCPSLSALFMLAALLVFLRIGPSDTGKLARQVAMIAVVPLLYALALLSKETAVTFPAIVVAACLLLPQAPRLSDRRALWVVALMIVALAAYLLARHFVLMRPAFVGGGSLPERVVLALRSLAAHVGLTILPVNLRLERSIDIPGWPGTALTGAGVLTLLVLSAAAIWFYRRDRRVVFGLAMFGLAFSLTSNLIPLNATFAERWLYWPMVGLLIAAAAAAEWFAERKPGIRRALLAGGWIAVAVYAPLTIAQNRVWRDEVTLAKTALARGSDTDNVRLVLAAAYRDAGNSEESRRHLEVVLRRTPQNIIALCGMGQLLIRETDYTGAQSFLERALQINPRDESSLLSLAFACEKLGNLTRAEELLRQAFGDGTSALAARQFATFYQRRDRLPEAADVLSPSLARHPRDAALHNLLGIVQYRQDRLAEAEAEFNQALRFDPLLLDAHVNLAAVASDRGDLTSAIQYYRQALRLAPRDALLHYLLAKTLQQHGQTGEAKRALLQALEINPQFQTARQMLDMLNQQRTD